MARLMQIRVQDMDSSRDFRIPIPPKSDKPVMRTDHDGFCYIEGTDGQQVTFHRTRLMWAHVTEDK